MINRIKRVIQQHYGEKEWFINCLRTGGWVHYPARTGYSFDHDEWRIEIDRVRIDIHDMLDGRYRLVIGIPTLYNKHFRHWKTLEITSTSEHDHSWEYDVRLLLCDAYSHPNVVCAQPVI